MRRIVCGVIIGAFGVGGPAVAQLCGGAPSFAGGPFQLSVEALFNDNAKTFGGGLALGGRGPFGQLTVGTTTYDNFNASSFNVGLGAGYQLRLDKAGTLNVCPVAGLGLVNGPKDINGSGLDYSETDLTAGLALGIVAARGKEVMLVPAASVAYASASGKLTDPLGGSTRASASFGVVTLGVGFVFGQRVSLAPSLSIPFAVRNASTTFGVSVAANLDGWP